MAEVFDVAIIGAGPAGSTAGRLLAQWGYSVAILAAPPSRRPPLAECLPPSVRKLFQFLKIHDAMDGAGFFRTSGNTVWWGKTRRRVEQYPDGWGYEILRSEFDRVLLDLARSAGVHVRAGKALTAGSRIEFQSERRRSRIRAKFFLDCSGRAGVLARALRVREVSSRTVALCGVWRSDHGWKLPDASHTLVESYGSGWAWSIPLSPTERYTAFMVDPGKSGLAAYHAELSKTRAFRKIFSRGELVRGPWGCDASLYSARRYAGVNFLLVGDAGSFIDPLSSFGVKKAMASAWMAAVAANTWLRRPGMRQIALDFFDHREKQVYAHYKNQSATWFRAGATAEMHPFWERRAEAPMSPESVEAEPLRLALAGLKRKTVIHLRRADGVRIEARPRIEGQEIVLRDAVTAPALEQPLDFIANVDLARLIEIAEHQNQVPDIFDAYNRVCPTVSLPELLTALSTLLARKLLIDR